MKIIGVSVILRPFFSNCIWDIYSYLEGGLSNRENGIQDNGQVEASVGSLSREMEIQTESSTTDASTQVRRIKWRPDSSEAQTQTDPKIFASIRESRLQSRGEEKVETIVQKLLQASRISYRLEMADSSKTFNPRERLKSLIGSLKEDAEKMPSCSLKTVVERVAKEARKSIRKIELGQEGPFTALEKRVEKLEEFCHSDKNYGQREVMWIQIMLCPDALRSETECIPEWESKLSAIYEHQINLQKQFVEAQTDLISLVKENIASEALEQRVSMLFQKIAKSSIKTKQAIKKLEKAMGAFGEEYPKFQELKKKIAHSNGKNGIEKLK